jgi:hypothetical protein
MLFWVTNEYGNIIGYHEQRRKFLDKAVEEFRSAAAAFPENRVIRMYLGEAIPCVKEYPGVEGAPAWAVYQRENLERLTDIVEWWIEFTVAGPRTQVAFELPAKKLCVLRIVPER